MVVDINYMCVDLYVRGDFDAAGDYWMEEIYADGEQTLVIGDIIINGYRHSPTGNFSMWDEISDLAEIEARRK